MPLLHVLAEVVLDFEAFGAERALVRRLLVTVRDRHVLAQVAFCCYLPAANLTLVFGVRMLWSTAAAALSMRRVVVSADR